MTVVCGLLQVVGKGKVVDHASLMKAITTIAIPARTEHWHVNNLTPTCQRTIHDGSSQRLPVSIQAYSTTIESPQAGSLVPVPIS
jgi:hypothetical protein